MSEPKRPASDAEWYCRKDPEADRFYEIFFKMCRKYHVSWCSASEKERKHIASQFLLTGYSFRKMCNATENQQKKFCLIPVVVSCCFAHVTRVTSSTKAFSLAEAE